MNEEKKIAEAILDAQKMHEESYKRGNGKKIGRYTLDMTECLIATCKKHKLSENLWVVLDLAMHWFNDIQLWAEDVLAGRNILDQMITSDNQDKLRKDKHGTRQDNQRVCRG